MGNTFREVLENREGNYVLPFFWQHGETEEVLRDYMRAIAEANIGAVCVESRPHPDFCGPKWWKDMDVIVDEAKKRGMKVWILDDAHFPTGYANGAVEKAEDELCHWYLDYRKMQICGPVSRCEIMAEEFAHPAEIPPYLPQPPAPKRVFQDDALFCVIACQVAENGGIINPVDLTGKLKEGTIIWDVPKGYWEIYVVYLTRNAKGRNDYINLLDERSCRLLIDAVYEPHYRHYGDEFGKTIAGFFSDETPVGNTDGYTVNDKIGDKNMALPWAYRMPQELSRVWKSENWKLYLPLLWRDSSDKRMHQKFRSAYMDAATGLIGESFSEQLGRWCHSHGVEYIGHLMEHCDIDTDLGPCVGHYFRGTKGQHMAGIDNIGGQVVPGGNRVPRFCPSGKEMEAALSYQYTLGKLGASAAAADPKKQGRCMCENLGAYGWQWGVSDFKYLMDHFMSRGVNYYVPHAFSPAPFPDPDCPPHFYAHGKNPQYRVFGELMRYTNKICHLIQGGKPQPDVAVLYHGESAWTGEYQSNMYLARDLCQNQIDFHILPSDVFGEQEYYGVKVEPDCLYVNGCRYKALVLCGNPGIPRAAAEFLAKAISIGFPVIFTDCYPEYLVCCKEEPKNWQQWLEMFHSCPRLPLGQVGQSLSRMLTPEVVLKTDFPDLSVYHYVQEQEVFLIMNENPWEGFDGELILNTQKQAVEYDAWENRCYYVKQEEYQGRRCVQVSIEPLGLLILVCPHKEVEVHSRIIPDENWNKNVLEGFLISRTESENYPEFREEKLYGSNPVMSVEYPDFSGYYRYRKSFAASKEEKAVLKLTEVYDSAEVFVNGVSLGMKVAGPWLFDLTGKLRDGENELVIEIATTMERLVHSMKKDISCLNMPAPMRPSGLMGKITLYTKK